MRIAIALCAFNTLFSMGLWWAGAPLDQNFHRLLIAFLWFLLGLYAYALHTREY
jgi:uncharacterized membrane protein